MKKIVVMSDNHGYHKMIDEIKRLEPDGDYYVHCGDSEALEEALKGWICVRGNNDWMARLEDEIVFEVEGISFLVTHGHRYGYFNREELMVDDLLRHGCDVLLSGHTHVPQCEEIDGFYLINRDQLLYLGEVVLNRIALFMLNKEKLMLSLKK